MTALLESPLHAANVPSAYSIRLMLANAPLYNLAPHNLPETTQSLALKAARRAAGQGNGAIDFDDSISTVEGDLAMGAELMTLRGAPHAPSHSLLDALIDWRGKCGLSNLLIDQDHYHHDAAVDDHASVAARRAADWGCFSQEESRQIEAARRHFGGPFNNRGASLHVTSPSAALPSGTPACGNQLMFMSQTGKHSLLPASASPSPCRPFACAICGSKFASLQALGGHKSAHRDGSGGKPVARASTRTCGAAAGGKRRRELSPNPPLRGPYSLYKDAPRIVRTAEDSNIVESEPLPLPQPLQPRVTGAPPQQPLSEAARILNLKVKAPATRPPRLTRIDSSTRSSVADTRHSGGDQSNGNQTSNQSGNQSGSTDTERAAILANIRQELGRLKRQRVSHVAGETSARSTSSDESDADVDAGSGARGASLGASDSAMAACDAAPHVKENLDEAEQQATRNAKNARNGREAEVMELNLFCSSGVEETHQESGSSGGACEELRTAQHHSAPAPVLDLALHL